MKCSVIVSAYQTQDYIKECIDSIKNQEPFKGWEYDIRIGVDGCRETANALNEIDQDYYFSNENVGPYIIRNSLIQLYPADAYAIFDSDDVMLPYYLKTLLPLACPNGIAGGARQDMHGKRLDPQIRPFRVGVCVVSHTAWTTLGGLRPWKIVGDSDMIRRAKMLRIPVHSNKKVVYHRRIHPTSLTQRKDIGFGSRLRTQLKDESKHRANKGELVVTPQTVPLTFVSSGP